MIATASDDGDVRVWGMTDGCPIAILRGHTGGANMVSPCYIYKIELQQFKVHVVAQFWIHIICFRKI